MKRVTNLLRGTVSALVVGFFGCGESSPDTIQHETESDGNQSGTAHYPGGSGDEGAGAYNGCLHFPKDGEFAFQHQCGGSANVAVHFTAVGALVGQFAGPHTLLQTPFFGEGVPDDSYEKPKVMACCKPLDDEEEDWEQEHMPACYHDAVENGCRSLVTRVYALKDEPAVPAAADPQINSLGGWLADHQQDCYEEFWIASGAHAWTPDSAFDTFPPHTWMLPSSAWTNNIEDIELEIEFLWMTDIHLPPDSEDWIECDSQRDNNDVSFGMTNPDPTFTYELAEGAVDLEGELNEEPVFGSAELASDRTLCSVCSYFTQNFGSVLRLDALVLESEDPAGVVWHSESFGDPDRFRVALYAPVDVVKVADKHYKVARSAAHFMVSVIEDGEAAVLSAYNHDEIHFRRVASEWIVDPFELRYVDASSNLWTFSVGELHFEI